MTEPPVNSPSVSDSSSTPTSRNWWQLLGPGLLYAGAAIGVSHLVQSTRAGAAFGFTLVIVIIAANVLKYPFFEFGPRYAAATGKTLLDGYRKLGLWAVGLFVLMSVSTMFIVQAAITGVTAGLAKKITAGWTWNPEWLPDWLVVAGWNGGTWSMVLLGLCMLILMVGRYKVLDRLMKVIMITLAVTTVVALVSALFATVETKPEAEATFALSNAKHLAFLVALIGWMPAPLDIAVWHSVWSVAKFKETGKLASMKEALFDFRVGFWGTAALAVCFLSLGALIVYGTGATIPKSGSAFAGMVINMYTLSLGDWAWILIAIAAFTTMFSTTLTVLDAYPRVLRQSVRLMIPALDKDRYDRPLYWFWILLVAVGVVVILFGYPKNLLGLVDLATTISFLIAPVLAVISLIILRGPTVPEEARPGKTLVIWSWVGIAFLTGIALLYAVDTFFPNAFN